MGMNSNAAEYRREWSVLTGRSESGIYVPECIRNSGEEEDLPARIPPHPKPGK